MTTFYILIVVCLLQLLHYADSGVLSYKDVRRAVMEFEDRMLTGGRIHLNDKEDKVNDMFMQYKYEELSAGFYNGDINAASLHFFKGKKFIEKSKIFKFLQRMPKGAILHLHNTASVSSEWLVRNISYMPGMLRCTNKNGVTILTFRQAPSNHGCVSKYAVVNDERRKSENGSLHDRNFEKLINLYTPVPEYEQSTIQKVWPKFQNMFETMGDVLRYLPAFRAYSWRMLEEMYEDNVMYAELRIKFKELYDSSGRTFSVEYMITELKNIVKKFKVQFPKFLGLKVIYSTRRNVTPATVRKHLKIFASLHAEHPDFIIGFDLNGQEDLGKPLYSFVSKLQHLPKTAKYFFHAGETNLYGSSSDSNLLDALLLNTTRIGHAYSLLKHPVLWNSVKKREVAIEVSPISNQVLHLVQDLRNHPASFYMSQNLPMVICNDDPGFWGTKGLSYDFYYAIMSMAPNYAGLKVLKRLVWNSIRYSSQKVREKKLSYKYLEDAWDHFLSEVLEAKVF